MVEFFIAKKQMLERKKQSFISILGILIGITVLTVSIGISNGLDKNMINSILSLTSHITIEDRNNIEEYNEIIEEISKVDGVKGIVPTIDSQGILKFSNPFGNYISGVKILAYDMEKAISYIDLNKKIIEGKIDLENKKTILIGNELSKIADINVGDTVKIITSENYEIDLTVSGIFQSGFYDYDLNLVIIPLLTSQYINYMGDSVGKLSVRLFNPYEADKIKNKIQNILPYSVYSWGDQNKALLSALKLEKTIMIIAFSLIVVIAGFLVWLSLNTLVKEKIKDIGILGAMGFSKKNIMNIFLIQGLILGTIGIIIGIILSLILLWFIKNYALNFVSNIYYIQSIPIEISLKEIFVVVFCNFFILIISSIFPAYKAAKLENVEALRYE